MVYPEPPGRSQGREHGLVCLVLALLRCLSGRAFRGEVVSLTRTVSVFARRQLDGASTARGEVATSSQQGHRTSAWHIPAGSSRRAACSLETRWKKKAFVCSRRNPH